MSYGGMGRADVFPFPLLPSISLQMSSSTSPPLLSFRPWDDGMGGTFVPKKGFEWIKGTNSVVHIFVPIQSSLGTDLLDHPHFAPVGKGELWRIVEILGERKEFFFQREKDGIFQTYS
jgi:hypothetical protein